MPRTPYSVDQAQGHGRRNGSGSTAASAHKQTSSGDSAAISLMRRPSTSASELTSTESPDANCQPSPTKPGRHDAQVSCADVGALSAVTRSRSKSVERKNNTAANGMSGHSAPPSAYTPVLMSPPVHPSISTPAGSSMYDALLPSFPTAEIAIEGITILTATVFRRVPGSGSITEKRLKPGTASSTASTFGASKKPVWQSHQLVLTAFRINDSTPRPTPNLNAGERQRQPSETRTVAHLHLFGQPQQKPTSRPTSVSMGTARKPITAVEGIPRVELERQEITAGTSAGVWENDDAESGSAVGRKWVLRVGFEGEPEEWLCDMPTG